MSEIRSLHFRILKSKHHTYPYHLPQSRTTHYDQEAVRTRISITMTEGQVQEDASRVYKILILGDEGVGKVCARKTLSHN